MADSHDMKPHYDTFASVMTLIKWGTMGSIILGFIVYSLAV